MKRLVAAAAAVAALLCASAGHAAQVPDGTISTLELFNPDVDLSADTFNANGATLQLHGTGAFSNLFGTMGTMNGTLNFSPTVGDTVSDVITGFFNFPDALGAGAGSYVFSVATVTTASLVTGNNTSGSLVLNGTTADPTLNLTDTPTSLTLSFNKTGPSFYSSSATLAIPPVGSAPEPSAWILMIAGVGLAGAAFRRSREVRGRQLA